MEEETRQGQEEKSGAKPNLDWRWIGRNLSAARRALSRPEALIWMT